MRSKLAEAEAIAIALPSPESALLPLETEAINHPELEVPVVPQSQVAEEVVVELAEQLETEAIATKQETVSTLPLLVRQLNWAPSAHLDCPGLHHDATLNDLKEALNMSRTQIGTKGA